MILGLACTHWGIVGGAALIGSPIDVSGNYTLVAVILVGVGMIGLVSVFGRTESVMKTMKEGPAKIMRFSYLVLSASLASNAGGIVLMMNGYSVAAWWAIGLGVLVSVLETSALLGYMYTGALKGAEDQ